MCDPANPIAGGACPVKNTGPPPVTYPLINAIQTPKQLRSRREGSWNAIGDNINAIDYYIKTLGTGSQYQGYGKRIVYDTGIKCSNMPGNAHRLADGTAAGVGGYGLVPRMLGGLAGFVPTDIVSSAKDEVQCNRILLHQNTQDEMRSMKNNGIRGIPRSNKIKISNTSGVNYTLVDRLCKQRKLSPCVERPVAIQDIQEGFSTRSRQPVIINTAQGNGGQEMMMKLLYLLIGIGVLGGIGVYIIKRS
jgi:hypothetical protein